jgi:GrpE
MSFPLWVTALLVIAAVLVTAAITADMVGRKPAPPAAKRTPQPTRSGPITRPDPRSRQAASPVLVEGLIGAHDLAADAPAVSAHIEQVLRGAGVQLLAADTGAAFDPETQLVIETRANGAERVGTVVAQVRPGWRNEDGLLRPTEVIVWTR